MKPKKISLLKTRTQVKNKFPSGIDKLEIGSGPNPEPGYTHLDIQPQLPRLDILADVRKMPIPSNWINQEIRAVHIMEHFCHPTFSSPTMRKKWGTTLQVIEECYRVLKPGAKLRIVTPDLEKISTSVTHRRVKFDWLQQWLVGGHRNEYDVHHWLWTRADADQWLTQVGFKNIRDWNLARVAFPRWQLNWQTPDTPGNQDWHRIEWYHWLFIEAEK